MKFGKSFNYFKNIDYSSVSGSVRPNSNIIEILNDIKPDLLPKVSIRKKASIRLSL